MNRPEVREVLLKAAALIRRGWCKNAVAKNADGEPVRPGDEDAVAWCAIGAIHKVCGRTEDGYEARYALRQVIGTYIQEWNDTHARDGEMVAKALEKAATITWMIDG